MSINSSKKIYCLNKEKELMDMQLNKFKINKINTSSFKNQKVNVFLKNNYNNDNKYNLFKTKSNIFPKLSQESENKTRLKKNVNLKRFLITRNIIVPTTPFLKVELFQKTRNHNINTMNRLNSGKESFCNTFNKARNSISSSKYKIQNKKRNLLKTITKKMKDNSKSFNILNDKIIEKNTLFKNYSEEKKNTLSKGYNMNPIKLFSKQKTLNVFNNYRIRENLLHSNRSKNPLKYKSKIKDYYCISIAGTDIFGKSKTNQDSFLSILNIYNLNNYSVFAIFDGHGTNGHFVSKYAKNYFQNIFKNIDTNNETNESLIYKELTNEKLMKERFRLIDNFLLEEPYSIQYSGSTCIIIIHIGDKIICYNIGDSRAAFINNEFKCIQISKDHKPEIPEEKTRIEECGGIVKKNSFGIYRVWDKNGIYPGLAMSRSIGDYVAKGLGIICEPDFYELNLINNDILAVILSSDGLWDILNKNQIEKIVKEYIIQNDCKGCINALTTEAKKMYNIKNINRDDITIIVIFFG